MKTTIKLTTTKAMTVRPCKAGGVLLELTDKTGVLPKLIQAMHLTADQAGALIFALEMATQGSAETLNDKG